MKRHLFRQPRDRDVDDVYRVVSMTDRHVWRQNGMTGSEHQSCVLCGAKTEGLGREADPAALVPCVYRIHFRKYAPGRAVLTVGR